MSLNELCTFWFWYFLPFLNANILQLCQIRWRTLVDGNFHVMPQIFKIGFKSEHKLFLLKPFICSFYPMLWLITLNADVWLSGTGSPSFPSSKFLKFSNSSCWKAALGLKCYHHHAFHINGVTLVLVCIWFCGKHYALASDKITHI